MATVDSAFRDELEARAQTIRETFGLSARVDLVSAPLDRVHIPDNTVRRLRAFNIEWHVIPSTTLVPFDDAYLRRMYPRRSHDFDEPLYEELSVHQMLMASHHQVQGAIVGVETTQKPAYNPQTCQQFYGSQYGLDPTCDPLRGYIERAGLKSGPRFINSRFSHTPGSLRTLGAAINADWNEHGLIPAGYQLFVCPPTVFNLVGSLFHCEWSETPTLELSAYRDDRGNGFGLAVGSNQSGDFSYARRLGTDPDLRLLGFRVALVPLQNGS